jgi:hypothetical protein
MPRSSLLVTAALGLLPSGLLAQASAYVPSDDPDLPRLELLISRGDVADPSPMIRPFRRADAVRVLAAAESTATGAEWERIRELLERFRDRPDEARWGIEPRAGLQAFSHARRDPLHPGGPSGVWPYVALGLDAAFGPVVVVSRPAVETRLIDDPDWPGRKNLEVTGRMVEAYGSAQFKWVRLFYGKMDQNWGPSGIYGIPLSDYSYGRDASGFRIGTNEYSLTSEAAQLRDETDTLGQVIHRYFFIHRLAAKISQKLRLGLWESVVLSGPDRAFDWRYRNPFSILLLTNTYGLGDTESNIMVGLDADWRIARAIHFQGQLGIDDISYQDRGTPTRYPDRYAFTFAFFGPLGGRLGWRALYSQASSLAFRTFDPFQNFLDAGVGIGRNFADNDQLTGLVTIPVFRSWVLTPEATVLRQGEGKITDPVPPSGTTAAGQTPELFIGTVERTYRAALGITGHRGLLAVQANLGFHHVVNSGNQAGNTVDRFEGRLTATIGHRWQGAFHDSP